MVRELIFHLGDSKTGTTSIQAVLAHGHFETDHGSLIYPSKGNHIPFAKHVSSGARPDAARVAKSLARKFTRSDADFGVISAEHFEFTDPAELAHLFDGPFKPWRDNVRLISYIRPHAERFVAAFVERTKKGLVNVEMDGFAKRIEKSGRLFYTPRVKAWQAAFGESYHVRPFVRDWLKDGDVVHDFFEFVFGDRPVSFTETTNKNESLSLEDLALMRYMQSYLLSFGKQMQHPAEGLGWNFSAILAGHPAKTATKIKLHRSLALKLQETYSEDAAALDALMFDGTPMSSRLAKATENVLESAQSLNPADYHSADTMRLVDAYCEYLGRIMAADPEYFRWASRVEEIRTPRREFLRAQLAQYRAQDGTGEGAAKAPRGGRLKRLAKASTASVRLLRDAVR